MTNPLEFMYKLSVIVFIYPSVNPGIEVRGDLKIKTIVIFRLSLKFASKWYNTSYIQKF
jgi:hypothetical protein